MNLFNIEAGPWGAFVLLVAAALAIWALVMTSWVWSGIAFVILVVVPITLILYFGGRRLGTRLIHGGRR